LRNLLVTGGCGFIGSAFIRRIFRESAFSGTVTNLDKLTYAGNIENIQGFVDSNRYEFVQADISDRTLVSRICRENDIDTIVHFAAESHVDRSIDGPIVFVETNVVGTANLLEIVRGQSRIHFHHVSTDEVYGSLGDTGRFSENSPYAPNSPYAASKAAADHLVRAYAHTFGLSVTISNCSNNYGPYQFPEKFIPLVISNLIEGKPVPIYGNGKNVRDWLHVDDHIRAIWTILKFGRSGETYNIGGCFERSNLEVVDTLILILAEELGCSTNALLALKEFDGDRPGHDMRSAIDSSKLTREFDFNVSYELEVGLHETVRWYLNHRDWTNRVRTGEYRSWINRNYEERPVVGK
jgi:dTDP-glucose 4,6-dehydratase